MVLVKSSSSGDGHALGTEVSSAAHFHVGLVSMVSTEAVGVFKAKFVGTCLGLCNSDASDSQSMQAPVSNNLDSQAMAPSGNVAGGSVAPVSSGVMDGAVADSSLEVERGAGVLSSHDTFVHSRSLVSKMEGDLLASSNSCSFQGESS